MGTKIARCAGAPLATRDAHGQVAAALDTSKVAGKLVVTQQAKVAPRNGGWQLRSEA